MSIFDIFKRKEETPKPLFVGRVLQYEEDDFLMVELLPRESLLQAEKSNIKTVERNIPIDELDKLLVESNLDKFDTVTTWYGNNQAESPYSVAYGDRHGAIIYERIRNVVNQVWLNIIPEFMDDNQREKLKPVLQRICAQWDLALRDNRHDMVVDVLDEKALEDYLHLEDK